jgi:hypothetical protein
MNRIKNILIAAVMTLLFSYWFLGSAIFTKYLYRGFDRNAAAQEALIGWLTSMLENRQAFLRTFWPNDTIPVYSSDLKLLDINQSGLHVLVRPLDRPLPVDSSWIRVELDKSPDKNPFSYTCDITGHCYARWISLSNGTDSLKSEMKIEHWVTAYGCRKFRWVAGDLAAVEPVRRR